MIAGVGAVSPLLVGPMGFLLGALLLILLILLIARVVFSLGWKLIVIAAIVLGVLWLVAAVASGPPPLS